MVLAGGSRGYIQVVNECIDNDRPEVASQVYRWPELDEKALFNFVPVLISKRLIGAAIQFISLISYRLSLGARLLMKSAKIIQISICFFIAASLSVLTPNDVGASDKGPGWVPRSLEKRKLYYEDQLKLLLKQKESKERNKEEYLRLRDLIDVEKALGNTKKVEELYKRRFVIAMKIEPGYALNEYMELAKWFIELKRFSEAQDIILHKVLSERPKIISAWSQGILMRKVTEDLRLCYLGGQNNLMYLVPILRDALTNPYVMDTDRIRRMYQLVTFGRAASNKLILPASDSYDWLYKLAQKRAQELDYTGSYIDSSSFPQNSEWYTYYNKNAALRLGDTPEIAEAKALKGLEPLLPFYKKHYSDTDFSVIGTYIAIGDIYLRRKQYDFARQNYMEALTRTQKLPVNCSKDYWYINLVKNILKTGTKTQTQLHEAFCRNVTVKEFSYALTELESKGLARFCRSVAQDKARPTISWHLGQKAYLGNGAKGVS